MSGIEELIGLGAAASVSAEAGAVAAGAAAEGVGAAGLGAAGAAAASAGGLGATLASVAPYASLLAGGVSAVGALQGANAQANAARYQSQILANNQTIAQQNAQWQQQAGEAAASAQALKTRATAGAIVAGEAASGVDVNSGSALDVRSSAAELGQLDALTIRSNYSKQVYGYQVGAASAGDQSKLLSAEADSAPVAGALGAGGSLLSGLSNAGKFYGQWQQAAGNAKAPDAIFLKGA